MKILSYNINKFTQEKLDYQNMLDEINSLL